MSTISSITTVRVNPQVVAPSWVSGLSLNTWTTLSNPNTFTSVQASNQGQNGNTGPDAVFISWCGAILASGLGTHGSMIHWGGGHTDYYGNEVYKMDLSTLTWERMNEPSRAGSDISNSPYGIRADGTPAVPHTYYSLCYRPSTNSLVCNRRDRSNAGGDNYLAHSMFDLDTETWFCSTVPDGLNHTSGTGGEGFVYDSARDVTWSFEMQTGLGWSKYNFATDTVNTYTAPTGAFGTGPAVYIPTKDCVLFFEPSFDGIYGLDPASPNTERVTILKSGSQPATSNYALCVPHWSSTLGAVVIYLNRSNTIYTMTPPAGDWRTGTWTFAQITTTGTSGIHSGTHGTYGKFQVGQWGSYVVGILNANVSGSTVAIRLA